MLSPNYIKTPKEAHNIRNKGYLLLELSITVLMLSILLGLTINSKAYSNIALRVTTNNLLEAMSNARLIAVRENTAVTICPSVNHTTCTNNWYNNNEIIFQKNHLTYKHIALSNAFSSWQASLNNTPKIIFLPNGKTNGEQGSISLRFQGQTKSYKITVNRSGNVTLKD